MEPGDLAGEWRGTWRTWVEPDELYSEGAISASIEPTFGGKAALVRYHATLDGDVEGVALRGATQDGAFAAWIDTWHTGGLVMSSHGEPAGARLTAATTYRAGDEQWRWESEYGIDGDGRLVIRHFNQGPGVPRYLGVEAIMERG